jgi:hypothetical protein
MTEFRPDFVSFGDVAGYGAWDDGHAREHLTFVQTFAQQSPAILIPAYDFLTFLTAGQGQQQLLESHFAVHQMLRNATGVNGVDLTQVRLDNADDLMGWLSYHRDEHAAIRQVLGM